MDIDYHRLARSWPKYAWWKPLVTAVIAAVFYLVLSTILTIPFVVLAVVRADDFGVFLDVLETGTLDLGNPLLFTYALAAIALLLPSIWFAVLIMGPRPVGLLSSVEGRLRWRWLARCILPALVVFGAVFAVSFLVLDPILGADPVVPTVTAATWLLVALALVLTPLQATAEEYVFRGFLMQTVGGWLRHPAWAILLPVPLFAIGHDYDLWGLADVAVFGIAAAWITWRTGGLEAAIVAHVVNNTSLFVLGAFGFADLNAKGGSAVSVATTLIIMAAYSALVVRLAKRSSLVTTRVVHQPALADNAPPSVPSPTLGV